MNCDMLTLVGNQLFGCGVNMNVLQTGRSQPTCAISVAVILISNAFMPV